MPSEKMMMQLRVLYIDVRVRPYPTTIRRTCCGADIFSSFWTRFAEEEIDVSPGNRRGMLCIATKDQHEKIVKKRRQL
jgi:hypothetical protein